MPGPAFGPSQWAYRENAIVAAPEMAASPVTATRWATADGSVAAAYIGGQLEVGPWAWPVGPSAANLPREWPAGLGDEISKVPLDLPALSYGSLSSLPGDPAEIIGILADDLVASDEAWLPGRAFEKIAGLFLDYVMPPAVAAQIYRALGAIPGVTADAAAIDAAGRRGPGFVLAGQEGGNQQITVSSEDYQFTGYQFFGFGRDLTADLAWGTALLRFALVAGPGVYP